MILTELFQSTYEYDVVKNDSSMWHARFKIASGEFIRVSCDRERRDMWSIVFARASKPDGVGAFGMTGSGDAQKILATVLKCLEEFVKAKTPAEIGFTSEGKSRSAVYTSMLKRFASKHGYKVSSDSLTSDDKEFYLTKA